MLLLGANELAIHGKHARKLATALGGWPAVVAPRLIMLWAFLCGALLLFSAATPTASGRLETLLRWFPLPLIEITHFLCAVAGALLLVLTSGLQRRIQLAYRLTLGALLFAAAGSVVKGRAYGEVLMLAGLFLAMLPAREDFDRREARLSDRFAAGWFVAFALAIAFTAWLFVLAYRDVEYEPDAWWQLSATAHLSRSLRAMAGAAAVVLIAGLDRLFRGRRRAPQPPTSQDREAVLAIVEQSPHADARLSLVGDMRLLIHRQRKAFILYGIEGRSWIAWGDPVGEARAGRELAWDFRELCDDAAAWPVFYQASDRHLGMYAELGLTVAMLGEVGRVHVPSFDWSDSARRELNLEWEARRRDGYALAVERRVWQPLGAATAVPPAPSEEFPIATVRHRNQVLAIAQLWLGADHHELAPRFIMSVADRQQEVKEFLLASLIPWAQKEGYEWLNLGLAPPAGDLNPPLHPFWKRIASAEYGEQDVPDIAALRRRRQRFSPVWNPRYLASPGGLLLPRILENVAELVVQEMRLLAEPASRGRGSSSCP